MSLAEPRRGRERAPRPPDRRRTERGGRAGRGRHAALLQLASAGDEAAFMAFYDATVDVVHRLVRCRHDADMADRITCDTYVTAWQRAAEQPDSGLSPLAWLATLVPRAQRPRPAGGVRAA